MVIRKFYKVYEVIFPWFLNREAVWHRTNDVNEAKMHNNLTFLVLYVHKGGGTWQSIRQWIHGDGNGN